MFTPVTREQSLTERAATELERVIVDHTFRAGERLPPERKLAEMIGVSRTVIREAVRLLSSKGLIEVRTGAGIFVASPGSEIISGPMNVLLQSRGLSRGEVHEVRTELEIRIAGVAALRATEVDWQAMESAIAVLSRRGLTSLEYAEADAGFHSALAVGTHNRLFPIFLESLNICLARARVEAFSDRHTRERALEFHIEILERVRERDVEGARNAMERHLTMALNHCYGNLAEDRG